VFVWSTKFNYLRPGQIYGSLEISLIGKVFSPHTNLMGKLRSGGGGLQFFPIFSSTFFPQLFPLPAACLW